MSTFAFQSIGESEYYPYHRAPTKNRPDFAQLEWNIYSNIMTIRELLLTLVTDFTHDCAFEFMLTVCCKNFTLIYIGYFWGIYRLSYEKVKSFWGAAALKQSSTVPRVPNWWWNNRTILSIVCCQVSLELPGTLRLTRTCK